MEFFEHSVFFGVSLSLLAYGLGVVLQKRFRLALFNPLLLSVIVTILVLVTAHIDYEVYYAGAKYLSYLLTPATVCLAVPLYEKFALLRSSWRAILAGILTQLALYSINLRIMDSKANQALSVDKYPLLLSQRYVRELSMNNPLPLLLLFTAAVIAILYWFFGTEKGSSLRATGANPHMARAQGINTNSNIVLGLMVSNGLVALSGALLAQYQGSSDINMGRGAIVIGLAAVIIGEVIFGKIFTNFGLTLLAVSIGAIIYYIVLQIVLQLGLNTNDLKLITALIVAVFLAIPYWKSKMFRRKVQPQSAKNGGNGHA